MDLAFCENDFTSELIIIVLTIVTLISVANLSIEDKTSLGRVLVFIGEITLADAQLETRLATEGAVEAKMCNLKDQLDCITKEMNDLKRQLKGRF